ITRDSRHKRRLTGGRRKIHKAKRAYETGRPPANTKLGHKRVRAVRTRGGHKKWRALRLDSGSFSWGSEAVAFKTRVLDVVYNSSNNELVRTKTLVKNAIVLVDSTPFRNYLEKHFHVTVTKKTDKGQDVIQKKSTEGVTDSLKAKMEKRWADMTFDPKLVEQIAAGRVMACISSRPGQSGRCDGYLLEGPELEFYMKQVQKKKGKK
ncbi:RPS8, partial [Symbiodinium sp. KB8]